MKRKIYLAALAGVALTLASCDDFLEPKSVSEFVPKDVSSLNELLLGEAYPRNDISGFNYFLTLMDDDVTATPWQPEEENFEANQFLASYTWQPDMFEMMKQVGVTSTDMYYTYYRMIKGADAVIDYIETVSGSEDDINNVMAQAHALRGFYYLNLVNIFGQPFNYNPSALGVPLKLKSGAEDEAITRNTVAECYDQILADLLEAERRYGLLPEDMQWKANYRTSLPMVQALLSRTYLYMENWAEASRYAKLVMDNSQFSLLDLNSVEAWTSDEYGWSMVRTYTNYHSYDSPECIWPYGNVVDWAGWVDDYSEEGSDGSARTPYFRASDDLLASFDSTDLRMDRYIVRKAFGSYGEDSIALAYGKVNVNNYYRPRGGTGIFGRSIRLSEVYLNYIEAEAMQYKATGDGSHLSAAVNALNDLRSKRFAPADYKAVSFVDADSLIEFIHNERRRELCFESQRWYDLRRWGMPEIKHVWYDTQNTVTTYTLQKNDPMYTVPIPDVAIEDNGYLVQNEVGSKRVGVTTNK